MRGRSKPVRSWGNNLSTEVIRFTQLGTEDVRFGLGTFEVILADGRKVTLSEVDVGELLNDATKSTQALEIVSLLTTSFIRFTDSDGQVLHAFGSAS